MRNERAPAQFFSRGRTRLHVVQEPRHRIQVEPLRRAAFVAVALSILACATVTPQRIAFNSLKTVRTTVESSLKVFNAGYQAGTYTELQRTQLGILYGKYLAADKIAAETLLATTTKDPAAIVAQVTIIASDVLKFIESLKSGP